MSDGVITCPAIRGIIHGGQLQHDDLKAAVRDLVRVFAGDDRLRKPHEPGSLANVTGFFAIFNHGVPLEGLFNKLVRPIRDTRDAAAVAAGKDTHRHFDLHLLHSRGDHPGTVNFIRDGAFQAQQFDEVMTEFSKDRKLGLDGIAGMIIKANGGKWDEKGNDIDLAKSSGEWGLMLAALGNEQREIGVSDLRELYEQRDPTKLLAGSRRASAHDWVKASVRIAKAITKRKADSLELALHRVWGEINESDEQRLCPCRNCNPEVWRAVG